ncbi:22928_t:CDS:2, partial [Racocetra persica]
IKVHMSFPATHMVLISTQNITQEQDGKCFSTKYVDSDFSMLWSFAKSNSPCGTTEAKEIAHNKGAMCLSNQYKITMFLCNGYVKHSKLWCPYCLNKYENLCCEVLGPPSSICQPDFLKTLEYPRGLGLDIYYQQYGFVIEKWHNMKNIKDYNELALWKVEVPQEKLNNSLMKTEIEQLGGREMCIISKFRKFFPEGYVPLDETIHIIVQCPFVTGAFKNKTEISRLEELGGTTYQGEEHGDAYESVDLTLGTVCKREPTINRLLKCLLERRIILVRSPPMAGKTTLAQLLEHGILQSNDVKKGLKRVFRISLLWMERRNESWTFAERFKELMNVTWDEFLDKCGITTTFLIIDEVQKIYKPENEAEPRHGRSVFWDSFKYILQSSRVYIVAFASYGYYGAYTAHGDHAIMDISPCSLQKSNMWRFEDVCFTKEEFNSYFNYFCVKNLQMLKEEDILLLSCYVSEITSFHSGLVAFTMNQIHMRFVKNTFEHLTFAKVFAYLKSRDFNDYLKDIRAMPKITDMLDEEKRIADTTNILVDTGMIKEGYSTINFPAPLVRATYLQNRFGSVARSKSPPNSFKDFIILVFAKISSKVLQKSLDIDNDYRLLERVWQMEFYHASMQVLPADIYASVDIGAIFGSEGCLYFYINDQRNWAIELLRNGDKLQEHQQKFQKNGQYASIFKYAKDKKELPEQKGKDMIYALCAENFESVQLMYPNESNDHVQLLGEEENLLGHDISEFLDTST